MVHMKVVLGVKGLCHEGDLVFFGISYFHVVINNNKNIVESVKYGSSLLKI
jgi:hypothetical protein